MTGDDWQFFNYEIILQEARARLTEARLHRTTWSADSREDTLEYWCAWTAFANASACIRR